MIELSNCLWVPRSHFLETEVAQLRKKLTAKVYLLDNTTQEVCALREDREGYLGLPRSEGVKLVSADAPIADLRSSGYPVSFSKRPTLRAEQAPVVADIVAACQELGDFIVHAATGKGKTVMGLAAIAIRGRTAAVVVDQENLLLQWIKRCEEHLGLHPDEIGIVRGRKVDYRGKKIVICMVQSIIRKTLPPDFAESFGTVIFDESHVAGAYTYSRALSMFSAEARFGLSATPNRRDAFAKLIVWHMGEVEVSLAAKHDQSSIYLLENPHTTVSHSANHSKMASRYISELAESPRRNLLIAEAILWLYRSGREVLAIGDRVEQLVSLRYLCAALGLPLEDSGLYCKTATVWVYEKDPRPARKPVGYVRGTKYTPIRLSLVQKTLKLAERARAEENSRVIFSTYGILSKGADIPRLSSGIDVTPRREATQTLGRTLRPKAGKLRPIWVTIADINSFRALFQLRERITDYVDSNAEVYLWNMEKGKKLLDPEEYRAELGDEISWLRRCKIVTAQDGNNTLLTPTTLPDSDRLPAKPTGRRTR